MSRQNRVTPLGDIVTSDARGTLMGNRGCIHDANGMLSGRRWARKQWVICKLAFAGRRRRIMAPGRYTELFFLDEATALAAGHRPCATCQRERYETFVAAWRAAHGAGQSINDIDNRLHQERAAVIGVKRLPLRNFGVVPIGAIFRLAGSTDLLLQDGKDMRTWTIHGYKACADVPPSANESVTLVTPLATAALFVRGFNPETNGGC